MTKTKRCEDCEKKDYIIITETYGDRSISKRISLVLLEQVQFDLIKAEREKMKQELMFWRPK